MSTESQVRSSAQVFKGALVYFAVVFGTGFVLGTIRVLWSVPRFGERNAELLEQPLMLIAVFLAARWTVRRAGSASRPVENLAIGLIALTLLLVAELMVVLDLRGLSISEYVRTRDPVSRRRLNAALALDLLPLPVLLPFQISYKFGFNNQF